MRLCLLLTQSGHHAEVPATTGLTGRIDQQEAPDEKRGLLFVRPVTKTSEWRCRTLFGGKLNFRGGPQRVP